MINWFGPHAWGAPICEDAPRCDVPVGVGCARCDRPFAASDEGVTMPGVPGPVAYHLECHLKSVLPHWAWSAAGLVPDACDGLTDGEFMCAHCGARYSVARGWLFQGRPR